MDRRIYPRWRGGGVERRIYPRWRGEGVERRRTDLRWRLRRGWRGGELTWGGEEEVERRRMYRRGGRGGGGGGAVGEGGCSGGGGPGREEQNWPEVKAKYARYDQAVLYPKPFCLFGQYSTYTQRSVYNCLVNDQIFNFADFPVQSLTKIRTFLSLPLVSHLFSSSIPLRKTTTTTITKKNQTETTTWQTTTTTTPPLEEIGLFSCVLLDYFPICFFSFYSLSLSLIYIYTYTHTHTHTHTLHLPLATAAR